MPGTRVPLPGGQETGFHPAPSASRTSASKRSWS